ncbi:mediator of RNA polymerase II transcription subunit 1-like [Lucilia sericata]|uniref:mediator of RNA polymerase II transcription subunit 1-like n=1 Tax=Lucilia sericata TaxID=13632 RepID=UPI0018A7EFFD|nr:mediator of RNA polymerase II transcription subunit 1-like [Lucilia sericata]
MAAVNVKPVIAPAQGASTSSLLGNLSITAEKNKQWQRELLMERIRSHSSQHKTFQELSKSMRMGMLEKRYPLDAVEKSNLQKCLDNMQHCIKVTSRQGLVERLESLSRQLSLKFSDDTKALFISTDMFFLEILLDSNGSLTDVKVHHESKADQQSCSELVDCLNRGDFADFTAQLEGFSSIYQLNAESKVKIKAYDAMQAMETDLYNIFQMQNFTKDTLQVIQDSIVGVVLKRRGGHPMRLVYFVSPYDLISLESKSLQSLSLDSFKNKQIGFSVTVNLEASSANKLQILPTVTVAKDPQTGIDVPVFAPLNQMNSMLLPATFVLRLNRPLPVCFNTLRSMGLCAGGLNETNPLPSSSLEAQHKTPLVANIMSLIIQTASDQKMKSSQKGLFVCLPDQTHCYFFTENKLLKSTLIHSLPFTEPSQVPKILDFLKKMALFYALLASCVRPQSKMGNDIDSTTILEVNAISFQQISVALQHPYEESMATVEFDLRTGQPQCTIYSISNNYDLLSIKLTSIVQKCLSIPVTIRALLRFWDQERMKMFQRSIGGGSTNAGGIGGAGAVGGGTANSNLGGGNMSGNMPSTSHAAYGNFNISGGSNDPGGGGMKMSSGSMKMDTTGQQRSAQLQAAAGGFLKYKSGGELKQEDFHESPKSQNLAAVATEHVASNLMQSTLEVNSLGQTLTQQQHQQQQQLHTQHQQQQQPQQTFEQKIAADHEIADKYKNIWKDKTPNLKNSVSITPINEATNATNSLPNTNNNPNTTSSPLDVKRTGGIEIIPLTGPNTNNTGVSSSGNNTNVTPTTITITPINAGSSPSPLANKEKKSSTSLVPAASSTGLSSNKRSLDTADNQKDKKRKKRRDDSPMGPPEKVFSRQNSPAGSSEAAATAVARKFSSPSSSPKGSSGGLLASSVTGSSLSARPSPKHSPVYSSPKHNTASNSPKSPFGTHSPKHGSSGKPSMSTLKSATTASPKGDKSSSSSNTSSTSSVLNTAALVRSLQQSGSTSSSTASTVAAAAAAAMAALKNKDKTSALNSAAVSSAAAAAAAAVKSSMGVTSMQQLKSSVAGLNHMTAAAAAGYGAANNPNPSLDLNSAMRKGVAAAVSLMTSTPTTATVSTVSTRSPQRQLQESQDRHKQQPTTATIMQQPLGSNELMKLSASSTSLAANDTLNTSGGSSSSSSEYMVKSSQEGLKLTINKTSHKSSSKTSSSSSTKSSHAATQGSGNSSSSSASGSTSLYNKKLHTGLKPGVNSGPASKKSTSSSSTSSSMSSKPSSSSASSSSSSSKHIFQKSNSSGSLSTKLGSSNSSMNTSSTGYGLSKSHSTNSFSDMRRSSKKSHSASTSPALPSSHNSSSTSQPATRLDHHADMMKILQYASPIMAASMEGFMKGLNSKFQIPKLSQRNNNPNANSSTSNINSSPSSTSTSTAMSSASTATSYSSAQNHPASLNKIKDQKLTTHSSHDQSSSSLHLIKTTSSTSSSSSSSTASSLTKSKSSTSSSSTSSSTSASSSSLGFLNAAAKSTNSNSSHVVDDSLLATLAAGK